MKQKIKIIFDLTKKDEMYKKKKIKKSKTFTS